MLKPVSFEETLDIANNFFIDVRAESEFKEDHIPGAINIPVFNDEERKIIGITYKTEGAAAARKLGLKFLAPRLPEIVDQIEELADMHQVVLYCWRGGLRSKSLALVLDLMDIPVLRLAGGYKAFRRSVNAYFNQQQLPFEIVVLHGLTGTGKTEVINKLASLGHGAINLEQLANNRGSVFGDIGLLKQPSQKAFESRLWSQFLQFKDHKQIVVECESKRIGRLLLPEILVSGMSAGRHILVYDSLPNRVKRIIREYGANQNDTELIKAIERLKGRLGADFVNLQIDRIKVSDYQPVVKDLLEYYYDPLYRYPDKPSEVYELCVSAEDTTQAAKEIIAHLTK